MITELLLSFFKAMITGFMQLLLGWIPPPPTWAMQGVNAAAEVWSVARSFDHWLPITLAFAVMGGVFAAWLAMVLVGIVRVVVSYFTFGGGAT